MPSHRARPPFRTPFLTRVALVGVVAAGLGGPGVGAASLTTASTPEPAAPAASAAPVASDLARPVEDDATGIDDVLWYGLLSGAAAAGALGAHHLAPSRPARRAVPA